MYETSKTIGTKVLPKTGNLPRRVKAWSLGTDHAELVLPLDKNDYLAHRVAARKLAQALDYDDIVYVSAATGGGYLFSAQRRSDRGGE